MADKKPKKSAAARTPADKAKAFKDLATARTNKAIKAMRQIKHLTNPSTYVYTPEESTAILSALASAYNEVEIAFKDPKKAKSEGFSLG
jgi:hypothetical protein